MRASTRLAVAAHLAVIATFLGSAPSAFSLQKLVRVPKDAKDLQAAIKLVADGGVIEMAAGTYSTPPKGFSISNLRRGFTVRAMGTVVLDGGGARLLLRFKNGKRDRGKRVTFEGITFRNGRSLTEGEGAVTLSAAEARFVGCDFENNHATGRTSGGGAVRVLLGSEAVFVDSDFRGNSSLNRGGALEIISSAAVIDGGTLENNRTNLPGHKATAVGGAVYVLNSTLGVSRASFQDNQAAWAGGAIYVFGQWAEPVSTPRSLVLVSRSTFSGNLAAGTVPAPGPRAGGAIHVEDHATLEVDSTVFTGNVADFGGAMDSYRSIVNVRGSRFTGNRTPLAGSVAAGGAIFATSVDFSDATTGFGAINRRPARVVLSDTLFQGTGGPDAFTGGCLLVAGDESRAYGVNGVPAAGTLAENRARLELRRTVFSGCQVKNAPPGAGGGSAGAVQASLVDLLMDDSLVIDSKSTAFGGGMSIGRDSGGSITRSTFARNSSKSGGGLFLFGSAVDIADSNFISNEASDNRGAAIFAMPFNDPAVQRNVGGVVANSIFTANSGTPIFDSEPASGPVNEVRYNSNQFHLLSGIIVYVHSRLAPNGLSVEGLNSLPGKSDGRNLRLTSVPRLGTVLGVPPFLGAGAPGTSGASSFLAFAWSGNSASLLGQVLSAKSGLLPVPAAGEHTLTVDGGPIDSAQIAAPLGSRRR